MNLHTQTLSNPCVRLEPLMELHREPLRVLANEPALWAQSVMDGQGNAFNPWFDTMIVASSGPAQISFAVYDLRQDQYAGHTSYLNIVPEQDRVEIGWTWYGKAFQGTHVNPACKRILIGHAFDAGALRVELKTGTENTRSQRAMAKMGATREGVLRSHTRTWRGTRRDTVYFSILADEWPDVRDGLDARLEAYGL